MKKDNKYKIRRLTAILIVLIIINIVLLFVNDFWRFIIIDFVVSAVISSALLYVAFKEPSKSKK